MTVREETKRERKSKTGIDVEFRYVYVDESIISF